MGQKKFDRNLARRRKHVSIRKKISGSDTRPRLVVFRSARNIYAQLVDDVHQRTITGISSLNQDLRKDLKGAKSKAEAAFLVGKALAEKARKLKIERVVFDRGGYLYHGRVKALADGAREGGLKF
ncbi:MAG: 50S ribosomal protein L18 [Calditrichaeota bacterium]|nr:MAG: 50S ribosomal protein L18 [Calditrichota bacterium]